MVPLKPVFGVILLLEHSLPSGRDSQSARRRFSPLPLSLFHNFNRRSRVQTPLKLKVRAPGSAHDVALLVGVATAPSLASSAIGSARARSLPSSRLTNYRAWSPPSPPPPSGGTGRGGAPPPPISKLCCFFLTSKTTTTTTRGPRVLAVAVTTIE